MLAIESNDTGGAVRRRLKRLLRAYSRLHHDRRQAVIVTPAGAADDPAWQRKREFFIDRRGLRTGWTPALRWSDAATGLPIGLGAGHAAGPLLRRRGRFYQLDPAHRAEGWEWIQLLNDASAHEVDLGASRAAFDRLRRAIAPRAGRAYVFGTGGSLSRAEERGWGDGIRIVCNTVVKDAAIWRHIDPDVIVAGDAIYHFGCSTFARCFRADLQVRLRESRAFFLYPAPFDLITRTELGADLADRLIPIPMGPDESLTDTVARSFELPALNNVLNLLLLPVACALSPHVFLWGFDGRGPHDRDFWKNADRCFYTDCVADLKALHPGFFADAIPQGREQGYWKAVHGDSLEALLRSAEARGFRFGMLHDTHTETLQRRRVPGPA